MPRFFDDLAEALQQPEPFALGIISRIKGSSPQKAGAKALFYMDGRIRGTLGGGCLEAEIQDQARRALMTRQARTFELVLDHDFGWDDGLICGGKVYGLILPRAAEARELFLKLAACAEPMTWGVKEDFSIDWVRQSDGPWIYQERVVPPTALWIAGAGHVAQAVTPLAAKLDFQVTVFDDRPALANHEFFPAAAKLRVGDWDLLLREPMPERPAFGLVVTRGHRHDAMVLANWIRRPFVFLGMIGSQRKARLIFTEFLEAGIASAEEISRVFCPVGLAIQAQSVNEIAISIAAQLVEHRAKMKP